MTRREKPRADPACLASAEARRDGKIILERLDPARHGKVEIIASHKWLTRSSPWTLNG